MDHRHHRVKDDRSPSAPTVRVSAVREEKSSDPGAAGSLRGRDVTQLQPRLQVATISISVGDSSSSCAKECTSSVSPLGRPTEMLPIHSPRDVPSKGNSWTVELLTHCRDPRAFSDGPDGRFWKHRAPARPPPRPPCSAPPISGCSAVSGSQRPS